MFLTGKNFNIDGEKKENSIERGSSILAAKAGFWYVCGNFVGKAITFITTPIFARLMTPSDYGEFSNFANWAAMLMLIVGAELFNTLSRAYYDFKDTFDEYISSVTILGVFITVTMYSAFLLCRGFVFKVVTIPEQYVHLLFVFLLFSVCRLVYFARERTLYKYKTVAVVTFITLFVPTVISVLLVYFLPESGQLSARLYGYYGPSAVIGLYCAVALFRKGIFFKWHYCRYALVLALPLLAHYLTAYLLNSTNIMIAKNISGTEAAAVISIAYSATHILFVFFQATSGALTTWVMDNLELGKDKTIRKGIFFYVLLLAAIIVGTILFTPEVIQILGGKKYVASVVLLPGLVFGTFVQAITTVFTIILTYDKSVVKTAFVTGLFALVSIAAKVFLLPDYGLLVLVYVNIAVVLSLFFINYVLVKRAGYANAIFLKGIVAVIILIGFLVALSPLLYQQQSLRYVVIGIFLAGCIIMVGLNRSRIKDIVGRMRRKRTVKNH